MPLFLTSSFVFNDAEHARALFADEEAGNVYSRYTNPNVQEFVDRLAALEGAEDGVGTASGMAAVFSTLAGLLSTGDHVVSSRALFGANQQILTKVLPRWGIDSSFVDASAAVDHWIAAIQPNTRLVFVETPSNPGLELADLTMLGELCRDRGLLLVIDNCFATPVLQQPIRFGATLVIHSATKFIDGQGRTLGGAVVGASEPIQRIRTFTRQTGPALSPFNAWILSRSLETLAIRMERHSTNALEIARHFSGHPEVFAVRYPFLETHPQHELAVRQMSAGGGIVVLEVKGGLKRARRFLNMVELVSHTANLGDTRTIVTHPASTTHAKLTEDHRQRVGIVPGMIRVSVGLEHAQDLIADLDQALDRSAAAVEATESRDVQA